MSARNDLYDLSTVRWLKSSYSGGDHGDCVEVAADPTTVRWRKSTHSGGNHDSCVEVSDGHPGVMPVRDSKNPDGPALVFPHTAWTSFIEDVKAHD